MISASPRPSRALATDSHVAQILHTQMIRSRSQKAPSKRRSRVSARSNRFRSQQNTLHHVKDHLSSAEGRRQETSISWLLASPMCLNRGRLCRGPVLGLLHRAWRFRSSRSDELSLVAPNRLRRFGGGERDRTDDLLLAKQALSQLSYTPGPASPDRRASGDRLRSPGARSTPT